MARMLPREAENGVGMNRSARGGKCSALSGPTDSVSHPGSDFYQSKSRSRGPARARTHERRVRTSAACARAPRAHERHALAVTASLSLVNCADIIT